MDATLLLLPFWPVLLIVTKGKYKSYSKLLIVLLEVNSFIKTHFQKKKTNFKWYTAWSNHLILRKINGKLTKILFLNCYNFSLGRIHHETIWACCFLFGKIINYWFNWFRLIDIGPFKLSIYHWVHFSVFHLQEIGPFHLSYQILEHRPVHSFSSNIHDISNDDFISWFSNLCPLSMAKNY